MGRVSWEDLTAFVREETGLRPSKTLTCSTRLWEDLGLTGDEADDFMHDFFQRFEVDPEGYDFHRYFLIEGEGLLYSLFRRWILRKPHTFKRESITLGLLYQVTQTRRWSSRSVQEGFS